MVNNILLYLASIILTALIEIGVILFINGDCNSRIYEILGDRNQTIGLILILIGIGLIPILNITVAFIFLMLCVVREL